MARRRSAALGRPVLSNQVQLQPGRSASPTRGACRTPQAADRLVIAYSPLGQGLLGGRYDATNRPSGSARPTTRCSSPRTSSGPTPLIEALRDVAAAHAATPAQVALAWLIRKPNVVAIPGASSVEQLEHNIAAADLDLSDDEDERLTVESDRFDPIRGAAAVPGLIRARVSKR